MFLFEKNLPGAYWIRLYDLGKGMAPFHAMAELKQIAQPKISMSQILIRKRGHQIVQ